MHASTALAQICRTRSEDRRIGGAGKKEVGRARRSGRAGKQDERNETTKGKGAPADQGKKLRRGRLIFRKEDTKGFIERLALWSDVVDWKDR